MTAPATSTAKAVEFEGHCVATVVFEGKPAWIAAQVGAALGYADGGAKIVDRIAGEWSEDFIAGTDFEVISSGRLAALRGLLAGESLDPPESGESKNPQRGARALTILYESGLHLALLKTRKPAGRRLRRLLATEVLPQLARTGRYAPEAPSPARSLTLPAPVAAPPPPPLATLVARVSPRTAESVQWAAATLQTTPEAVVALVLDQWAETATYRKREGVTPPTGKRGYDRWLMVAVCDHVFDVLTRHVASFAGRAEASPVCASAAASRILEGHAIIVDAASAFPPSLRAAR